MKKRKILSLFTAFSLAATMFGTFPAYADDIEPITLTQETEKQSGQMTITLTIPLKTAAATDFDYTAPTELTYDGTDKAATVAVKTGVTGMGDITVHYYSDSTYNTEVTDTKNVGTYYVGITLAAGTHYAASTAAIHGDNWSFEVTVSTPDAPPAPTKASATKNSITLTAVDGYEYSKDGATWQENPTFEGLLPSTQYTFYQRVKATANNNVSESSIGAEISTLADTYDLVITLTITPEGAVIGKINALPNPAYVTTYDEDDIEAARAAYDALTPAQQANIPAETYKKLTDAEDALAAAEVTEMITALPEAENVTIANGDDIEAARAAYNGLTDAQKAYVPQEKLAKFAADEDALAAAKVTEMIKALPAAANVTTANQKAIEKARAALDGLSNAQKTYVNDDIRETLANAEKALVVALINALPDADKVTAEDKDTIEAAREAYDKLTEDQQGKIDADTLKKLTDAEEALKRVLGFVVSGIEDMVYTGKAIKQPNLVVTFKGEPLDPKKDYTVTYKNNRNVGTATVTIKGKGNFSDEIVETFEIEPADISTDEFYADDIALKSNGRDQKKTPKLLRGTAMVPANNYTITYCEFDTTANTADPVEVKSFKESYAILLTGKGNFTGTRVVKVEIFKDDNTIAVNTLNFKFDKTSYSLLTDADDYGYVEPTITVSKVKTVYVKDVDYELTFADNDKVGTARVTITGLGTTLCGSVTKTFRINSTALTGMKVTGVTDKVFDPNVVGGIEQDNYTVKTKDNVLLVEDEDYVVTYRNNTKAGSAQMIVNGIGKYNGTKQISFKIEKAEITAENVECAESAVYTKSGAKPEITVTVEGVELVPGVDYGVTYSKNNALTSTKGATAKITGKGNFKGTVECSFNIDKAEILDGDGSLSVEIDDQVYNGTAKTKISTFLKAPKVKGADGKALVAGTDYEKAIVYSISDDGINFTELTAEDMKSFLNDYIDDNFPGLDYEAEGITIKAEVTLKGNYEGTYSGTFRIATTNINTAKSIVADQPFTGEAITFDPSAADFDDIFDIYIMVKNVKTKLVYGVDFEIVEGSYEKNTAKGTASVKIRGLGKYSGIKKVTFKIVARPFEKN